MYNIYYLPIFPYYMQMTVQVYCEELKLSVDLVSGNTRGKVKERKCRPQLVMIYPGTEVVTKEP